MGASGGIDGLVRDVKRTASKVPPRIRLIGCILFIVCTFYYLFGDNTVNGLRPKSKHGYVPRPGGEWNTFDSIISLYVRLCVQLTQSPSHLTDEEKGHADQPGSGDSWSATGFYNGGVQPNEANPLGNPDLPVNGKTHPPNWLHYLTLTYNETFIRTYNLAHGAATIDRRAVPPHEFLNWTHTFREQVDDIFIRNYTLHSPSANAAWEPPSTLFAIWFGVVDISLLVQRKDFDKDNVIHMINAYHDILSDLYAAGARHFLLLTAPPMYLSPSAHEEGANPFLERMLIREFNGRLYAMRKAFLDGHAEATAYIFDTHGLMTRIVEEPTCTPMTRHLRNTTENCWDYDPDMYGDPKPWDWFLPKCNVPFDEYLWANHLHPTHVFHNATAAAIVSDCMSPRRKGFCS